MSSEYNAELIQEHQSFALSFIRNDPALLIRFLSPETVLYSEKGEMIAGLYEVLSYLVAKENNKRSRQIQKFENIMSLQDDMTQTTYITRVNGIHHTFLERILWENQQIKLILRLECEDAPRFSGSFSDLVLGNCQSLFSTVASGEESTRKCCSYSSKFLAGNLEGYTLTLSKVAVSSVATIHRHRVANPYIKLITSSRKTIWKSSVKKNCTQPVWDGNFGIVIRDDIDELYLLVKDKQLTSRDVLGLTTILVKDLDTNEELHYSLRIPEEEDLVVSLKLVKETHPSTATMRIEKSPPPSKVDMARRFLSIALETMVGINLLFHFSGFVHCTSNTPIT